MAKRKLHMKDLRLKVNAGMDFPCCYSNARLLDLDKSGLPTTNDLDKVTCKHCRKAYVKRYRSF